MSRAWVGFISVFVVTGVGFFVWKEVSIHTTDAQLVPSLSLALQGTQSQDTITDGVRVETETQKEPLAISADELTQLFEHKPLGFSFRYPEGYSVGQFDEGAGQNFLIQNQAANNGFQLYITPFDEAGPITPERIRQDVPDLVIESPQRVLIADESIEALIFYGQDPEFGSTREVWFVARNHLFQVMTYRGNDQFIGPILETLTFQ